MKKASWSCWSFARWFATLVAAFALVGSACECLAEVGSQTPAPWDALVQEVVADGTAITVQDVDAMAKGPCRFTLAVSDASLKTRVGTLHKGDLISVMADAAPDKNPTALNQFIAKDSRNSTVARAAVLFGTAAAIVLLLGAIIRPLIAPPVRPPVPGGGNPPPPNMPRVAPKRWSFGFFMVGADDRYSNSKVQLTLWFAVVLISYIATLALRLMDSRWQIVGGITIPNNLLMLSGLSVLSFGGAKAITTAKIQGAVQSAAAAGQALEPTAVKPPSKAGPQFLVDLLCDDQGNPDLGDFQMLVMTGLAIATYSLAVFQFLSCMPLTATIQLPDVDSTVLAAFGLGQGAYLLKKAVGDVAAPKAQ